MSWDPFLMTVKLAHFNGRTELGVLRSNATQSDVLSQDGRSRAAGNHTHVSPPHVHTVAVSRRFVAVQFQADQFALGMLLARHQCRFANKIVLLGFQWNSKTDSRLEGIHLAVKFIACKNQSPFNSKHIKRVQTQGSQAVHLASFPDRVPHLDRVVWVAPDFVPEFAGVSCARDEDRNANVILRCVRSQNETTTILPALAEWEASRQSV